MLRHLEKRKSILKYLATAILIAVPLFPKFPFLDISGTYVSLRLEDLLLAVSAIVFVVLEFNTLKRFLRHKLVRAIVVFLVIGFASLVSAVFVTKTAPVAIVTLHWLRRIQYFIPLFIGYVVAKKRGSIDFFVQILVLVTMVAFFYGLGQKYLGWPVIITQNAEYAKGIALRWIPGSHINSTFAGHYDLASYVVLSAPIFVASFFTVKNKESKVWLGVAFFASLWLLVNAVSRISIASHLGAVTVSLFLIKKYKQIPVVIIVSLIYFSTSGSLVSRYLRVINSIGLSSPIVHAAEGVPLPVRRVPASSPTPTPAPVVEDRSTSIRVNVEWPRALRAFRKNPLLGTGYSSITLATDNDYLRALGEIGALGLAMFLVIIAQIAASVKSKLPLTRSLSGTKRAFVAGFAGGFLGILVNATFIDIFEASKFAIIFWLLVGMMLAVTKHVENS